LKELKKTDGIVYLSEPSGGFEDVYAILRKLESRDYDDSLVKVLPKVERDHKHFSEWKARDRSSNLLCSYIGNNKKEKKILELGCGNGWLVNRLSEIENTVVRGMDVNISELKQAARIFGAKENVLFLCGDVFEIEPKPPEHKFDYIILSAVLAYFENPARLINKLFGFLNPGGEVHILDSPFYKDTHAAKIRSQKYFESLGCSAMITYYHHHSLNALNSFEYEILYNPGKLLNRLKRFIFGEMPPFYWLKINP
jgi:ubiquinone/menaquinone biosynthesis C-methylase UbiE